MKAIIIDDEAKARRILHSFLTDYCKQIEVAGFAEDVTQGVKLIQKEKPDVVFLDIEMPGYNGFQLLDFFDEIDFQIIFVTAYSEFALKAFQVSAVDYLLKPLQIEQLIKAVEKAEKLIGAQTNKESINILKENVKDNRIKKIIISTTEETSYVNINDITHLKAEGSYVYFYFVNGKKTLVSKNIKDYEEQLTTIEGFYRIHRSYLVNTQHIANIHIGENEIEMTNNEIINIARDRKQEFLDFIKKK